MSGPASDLVRPGSPPRVFDAAPDPADPRLRDQLETLRVAHGTRTGPELIEATLHEMFPGRTAVVSSFGAESAVLLHMVAAVDPATPVLFLNTGKLFGETLRYRDRLQERLGLTDIRSAYPHPDDLAAIDPDGTLWARDPDACCALRKVRPRARAIAGFAAEITGRKRFQTRARARMHTIELAGGVFKLNPLAEMTRADLDAYMEAHDLPSHPLVRDGYLSIGCMPCTRAVRDGETYREGRWAGRDKDECGIHIDGDGI